MNRTKKYLLRGIGVIVGILIVFWVAMYAFFIIKKEDIRQQLSAEIGNAVRGEFEVKDLGMNFFNLFPNVSLSLKGVEMKDSSWSVHKQSLLKAKEVFLRINPFALISGNVRISKLLIEDAVINMFADSAGYTNEYLFSPKGNPSKTSKSGFHLEEIVLKNVRIIRSDQIKNKLYDLSFRKLKCEFKTGSKEVDIDIKLDGMIHSLAFNLEKGSYAREKTIKGNFELHFLKEKKQLSFENVRLAINRHAYNFNGLFDFSSLKDFRLAIRTNKIQYRDALTMLPEKIRSKLSLYSIAQPIDLAADLSGKMVFRSHPKVVINSKIPTSLVNSPVGDFKDLSLTANFTNAVIDSLPFTDENSMLTFTDLTGNFEGIPISSKKVTINNLIKPFLRCDLKAETNLSSFNNLLSSASFDFISGQVKAEVSYAGGLVGDTSTCINGYLDITNGSILYQPRRVKLENINGKLIFDSTDVLIKDLQAEAQANKVKINAVIKNMINLMMKDPSKLFVDADIVIPSLDLYSFKTMLGTRKKKTVTGKAKFARLAEGIDRFMDDCSISSRLQAGKVKYKNFLATDVEASLTMNANKWNLQKVLLHNSDGTIALKGTLTAIGDNNNAADVQADINNVNVSKLFTAFENFGLTTLRAENLKGTLTSKTELHAILDDESRLIGSSLSGNMDLSLRNGELIDFEPLQKMAVFVLKKRDFSRVEFAEIKNTFEINGQTITIHKMEIQSNVLGLYVDGLYDLKGKNTDLVVQVPLKYLKKRAPDYQPENQGLDAKTGISVFVRAKNADNGEIDFKYGIFKKKSALEKSEREKEKDVKKTTDPLRP